jgi:hypothetical protein
VRSLCPEKGSSDIIVIAKPEPSAATGSYIGTDWRTASVHRPLWLHTKPRHRLSWPKGLHMCAPDATWRSLGKGASVQGMSVGASLYTRPSQATGAAVRPNPSLNRTRYGRPPWPELRYAVHFLSSGQGVLPPQAD